MDWGILVQKDLENGRRQPFLSPVQGNATIIVGVGKDCSRLQTARDGSIFDRAR